MNDDGSAPSETLLLTLYQGNTAPGPGSSGPGTNKTTAAETHVRGVSEVVRRAEIQNGTSQHRLTCCECWDIHK